MEPPVCQKCGRRMSHAIDGDTFVCWSCPGPPKERCETCEWWDDDVEAGIEVHYELFRKKTSQRLCKCPSIVYLYGDDVSPTDHQAVYYDAEGYEAVFATGPKFGCVHWKQKLGVVVVDDPPGPPMTEDRAKLIREFHAKVIGQKHDEED